MKQDINPAIKAHLLRGAFYLLLLLAVCVIPFALAQRTTAKGNRPATLITVTNTNDSGPFAAVSPATPECPPGSELITVLADTFDGVTPPTLPAGWTATNAINPDGIFWQTSNAGVPSPPADSPPNAAWVNDPPVVSDKYLDAGTFFIFEAWWAQLTFRHNFNLESSFDGGVLEISSFYINNGAFTDITDPAVGGSFETGGYNAIIATGTGSPIAGRHAWSGNSGGFITTTVNLPTLVIDGKLRWRMASDNSSSGEGWRIDNITLVECHFNGLPSPTTTPPPRTSPTPRSRPSPAPRPLINQPNGLIAK